MNSEVYTQFSVEQYYKKKCTRVAEQQIELQVRSQESCISRLVGKTAVQFASDTTVTLEVWERIL